MMMKRMGRWRVNEIDAESGVADLNPNIFKNYASGHRDDAPF
jgi:hypothetical protein